MAANWTLDSRFATRRLVIRRKQKATPPRFSGESQGRRRLTYDLISKGQSILFETPKTAPKRFGASIGVGVAIGTAVGVATGNIGLWLSLGIAFGCAFATYDRG